MKHNPPTGGICPNLATAVCSGLLLCLSPQAATGTEEERPLVLQYQVSHSRNVDQISLIFGQDTVRLVVNTDFWQKEAMPPRLGIFEAGYDRELSHLKRRVERYHHIQVNTVSFRSLMDLPYVPNPPRPVSGASRIFIGGEEVSSGRPHYKVLFGIIRSVWDHQWSCVHCASYRMQGDSIVRTIKGWTSDGKRRFYLKDKFVISEEFAKSYKFQFEHLTPWTSGDEESLEIPGLATDLPLDCIPRGHSRTRMECADSRFGLFHLPMPGAGGIIHQPGPSAGPGEESTVEPELE